jgi:hypothetical protein
MDQIRKTGTTQHEPAEPLSSLGKLSAEARRNLFKAAHAEIRRELLKVADRRQESGALHTLADQLAVLNDQLFLLSSWVESQVATAVTTAPTTTEN